MNRRELLKAAGAGMASLAAIPAAGQVAGQRPIADGRVYAAGRFALELDSVSAGWLNSAEGGHATADVVTERLGADRIVHKHLGGVRFEDFIVECGVGMSKALYTWMKDSLDRKYTRKNGAIVAANYDYKEISRTTFNNALISEIGFPALDASSKDAAKMTIKIAPEYTRMTTASAGTLVKTPISTKSQKRWLPANFRIKIDGLDAACSRVNKVEAITIKQKMAAESTGVQRERQRESGYLEIPNLVITLPESHAADLYRWHEDFVIKGNNTQEKGGTLEYLTPDMATVLFTLTFVGLGIFKVAPDKSEAGSDQIRRVKAEMYCEDIKFDYKDAAA